MKQLAVVIGRFQPPHRFHIETLLGHTAGYDAVIVLLGSSRAQRTPKNPLKWQQREKLIRASVEDLGLTQLDRMFFRPIIDYPGENARWIEQNRNHVNVCTGVLKLETGEEWEPVLIGMDKDHSSFYLQLFPDWKSDIFPLRADTGHVSATTVRDAMFREDWDTVASLVTSSVLSWMSYWISTPEGQRIKEEYLEGNQS